MTTPGNGVHIIKPEFESNPAIIYFEVDRNVDVKAITKEEYLDAPHDSNKYLYSYVVPNNFIIQVWERDSNDVQILNVSAPIDPEQVEGNYGVLLDHIANNVNAQPDCRLDFSMYICLDYLDIDYGDDDTSDLFKEEQRKVLKQLGIETVNEDSTYCICAYKYDFYVELQDDMLHKTDKQHESVIMKEA